MERKKRSALIYKQRVLLLCAILLIAGALIGFVFALRDWYSANPVRRSVSVKLNFTYDGAAHNKMPNGEAFTIEGIKSDKVIDRALENLVLKGECDTQLIKECLRIKGSFPKDVMERVSSYNSVYDYEGVGSVNQEQYYATEYTITLYDDFKPGISTDRLKSILGAICDEFETYFRDTYVYKMNDDSENREAFMTKIDYRQQIDVIRNRLDMVEDYAGYLYSVDANFSYKGMNFKDIGVRCEDLKNNYLSGMEAKVMMKVYSKDPERLKNMYQYRINILNNQVKRTEENLKEVETLIDNYQMDDILYVGMGGESVVAIESNSTKTYEALVTEKINLTDKITELNAETLRYKGYLQDLTNEKATSAETAVAEMEINDIVTKMDSIEATLREMLDAFNLYKLKEEDIVITSVKYNSPSILSFAFIKRMIKFCVPIYLFMFAFFGVNMMIGQIKGLNERKTEMKNA